MKKELIRLWEYFLSVNQLLTVCHRRMRPWRTHCLLLTLLLAFSLPSLAQERLTVAVWPEKVLYDVGETAQIAVTIKNKRPEPFKGKLEVILAWEMEDTQIIFDKEIALPPYEITKIAVEWKAREVLGCEVRANLIENGQIISTSAEYFNVCRIKDVARVGMHGQCGGFHQPDPETLNSTIPESVLKYRSAYGNIVELNPPQNGYSGLAPKDENLYAGPQRWNKTAYKRLIDEGHKHGIKFVIYATGYILGNGLEILQQHPEYSAYWENGRIRIGGILDVKKIDAAQKQDPEDQSYDSCNSVSVILNFLEQGAVDFGIKQLIENKKMSGMDGVRFDGHYMIWSAFIGPMNDIHGKPFPNPQEAIALTKKLTEYTKKKVWEAYPDYLFMFNNCVFNLSDGAFNIDTEAICSHGGASCDEVPREAIATTSPFHSWKALKELFLREADECRRLGGHAYNYVPGPWDVVPNVDRISYPLMFACANHPFFGQPALDRASDKGGSHFPIQKDLYRFATRFSAALWGYGIERIKGPFGLIEVKSPKGTIWWEDFVYQRKLANGKKQTVVHLINEPPSQNIEQNTQELPVPIQNVTVRFKKPVSKAWIATPDPVLTYQKVSCDNGVVTVPNLAIWTMVVAEE